MRILRARAAHADNEIILNFQHVQASKRPGGEGRAKEKLLSTLEFLEGQWRLTIGMG